MKVLRVSFVGVRSGNFAPTVDMFRDVLGMDVAFEHPGWTGFDLPSGDRDLLEIFGAGDVDERLVPAEFEHGVLVAFAVEDVVGAREELAMAGIELIGELVWAADVTGSPADQGWGWCFFRAPDGNVYVLQQDGVDRGG
jgi:catechol 2,3-dioxygenase-like lactoylglutathione lyase family enzyme